MTIEKPERRARNIALVGLVLQGLLCGLFSFLWIYSASEAMHGLALLTGVGIWIWFILILIYHQRVLVQDEAFETEQLRRERESGITGDSIFDTEGERLLLAKRRLRWMYRWLLPIFTAIIVVKLLGAALFRWPWGFGEAFTSPNWPQIQNLETNSLIIWLVGGAAFVSFLVSRYVVGMARHPEWKMLRAGSSYLMGTTLAAVATAAILSVVHFSQGTIVVPEHVLAYVLRILLLVLAVEFAMNFVLDLYRPRSPEEEPRPAFDSRLLGLFSEPGGIARSIAEAINYQFGFDVSSTWFYQLLQRSVVPLLGFAVLMLFLASCLVFVDAGDQVVIERFGQKLAVAGPGLRLKLPWPIDVAHKVGTAQIHELKIGLEEEEAKKDDPKKEDLILWTNKHSQEPHLMVLLATPELSRHLGDNSATQPAAATRPAVSALAEQLTATRPAGVRADAAGKAVPVSMLRIAASIQYTICDAWNWLTQYEQPEKMLQAIANREIMRHCASADVMGLLGTDRGRIEREIWDAIQKSADADHVKLGVKIVFFGLQGVHPPETTAEDFQKVITAEHQKISAENSARSDYNKKLNEVAGDIHKAKELSAAIRELNQAGLQDAQQQAATQERIDRLFLGREDLGISPIGGQAAVRIADARARRWELENQANSRAVSFVQDAATLKAAPEVFRMRKYLETLANSMDKARKYIIASQGRYELPFLQINLQDPMPSPLDTATADQH